MDYANKENAITLTYPACFLEDKEVGGFTVRFPDLKGCVTEGDTLAEAILMAEDAASGWVLIELEDGNPAPEASNPQDIKLEEGEFVNLIALDMAEYASKYGEKTIRRTLTIPAWLNTFAEKRHINVSKLLQDTLADVYKKTACL
jgi:predicted RNase H-like HicB family nuclease